MAKFREIDNLRASLYVYVMMSGLFYHLPVSTQPFPPSTATLGLDFYIGIPGKEFNHQFVDASPQIENRWITHIIVLPADNRAKKCQL